VAAVIQARPGQSFEADELVTFCKTKVAGYKVPRQYHEVEAILRHPSGKPDYRWAKSIATGDAHA
jgi:acyl-CoA synthetase (AMP-forming)/AMP-acid ligase II